MPAKPKMSARKAAVDVLRKATGAMAAKDVVAAVLADYETGLKGLTPAATVSAQLYLAAKAGEVTKVGRGMFEATAEPADAAPPADADTTEPPADTPAAGAQVDEAKTESKREARPHPKPSGRAKHATKKEAAAA